MFKRCIKDACKMLEKCKNLTYTENTVKILSALNEESSTQLEALANELCN